MVAGPIWLRCRPVRVVLPAGSIDYGCTHVGPDFSELAEPLLLCRNHMRGAALSDRHALYSASEQKMADAEPSTRPRRNSDVGVTQIDGPPPDVKDIDDEIFLRNLGDAPVALHVEVQRHQHLRAVAE